MSHLRILGYLGPRISQLLGWTFEPNVLMDPLLQNDKPKIPDSVYQSHLKITSSVLQYVPPPFQSSIQFPADRLKRNF